MQKDDATWLNVAYIVFAVLVGYVGYSALEMLGVRTGWLERFDSWYPIASTFGAIAIGVGVTLWLKADKERHEYFLSAIGEVRKVVWPSFEDTKRMTIVVGVVVAVFAVIVSLFDAGWAWALSKIL
jgi:preprotein translocase subunit SecE